MRTILVDVLALGDLVVVDVAAKITRIEQCCSCVEGPQKKDEIEPGWRIWKCA